MSLRDHLQAIHDNYGRLTPTLVVTEARTPEHPLHSRFEWDDEVAGEQYRKVQARELIRSVRVVYREPTETDEAKSVRAFHAVRDDDGERSYEPVDAVVEDEFLARLVMADMQREWMALKRRYANFEEFWQMVHEDAEAV